MTCKTLAGCNNLADIYYLQRNIWHPSWPRMDLTSGKSGLVEPNIAEAILHSVLMTRLIFFHDMWLSCNTTGFFFHFIKLFCFAFRLIGNGHGMNWWPMTSSNSSVCSSSNGEEAALCWTFTGKFHTFSATFCFMICFSSILFVNSKILL